MAKLSRAKWRGEWYLRTGIKSGLPASWRNRRTGKIKKTPPQTRIPKRFTKKGTQRLFSRATPQTKGEDTKEHFYDYDRFLKKRKN